MATQEHVTEYGVHWNFFFTLAILPLFGTALYPFRQRGVDWTVLGALMTICGFATTITDQESYQLITAGHQFFLSFTPFQHWVLSPVRHGLIGANKEGLASLPGYTAIYLLGLATGQHILRATALGRLEKSVGRTPVEQAEERYRKRRTELALELFGYAVAWWTVLALCRVGGMGVSRRLVSTASCDSYVPRASAERRVSGAVRRRKCLAYWLAIVSSSWRCGP